MSIRLLLLAIFALGLVGCCPRNIYRNAKFAKPPLVTGYIHSTRTGVQDAGVEPVEYGEAVVTEDTIFVASETGGVEAFERTSFARKWRHPVKNGVASQMLLDAGVLYFGGEDGAFHAVDAEFGREIWHYDTKAPVFARATISGPKILLATSDDIVVCLDKATGKWLWHYKRTANYISTIRGNTTPAVSDNLVYAGFSDGYLTALNLSDGNLQWEVKVHNGTKFLDVDGQPIIEEGKIYVTSYDGGLYVLEKAKGKILWRVDYGGVRKVVLEDKMLYLSSTDGHVYALNKDSGRVQWSFDLDRGVPTNLIVYQNYIAFGSSQEFFYVIHKGDGTIAWRFDSGLRSGFSAPITMSDNEIFALSNSGNLYTFRWKTSWHPKYFAWQ